MGVSTRPKRQRHQVRGTLLSSLVAFCFLAAPSQDPQAPSPAPALPANLPAATGFALVQPGDEEIELSARFTEKSRNYADTVDWKVKNTSGETLFEASAAVASFKLKPGSYEVIGHYGNVAIDEAVTLPPQTRLSVNFILNAGGLRILPRLPDAIGPAEKTAARVYALNGAQAGRLVAPDVKPGEVLKLAGGTYRVETRFEPGNVTAVTDVEVKPGFLRALDIAHHAGLAHFSLAGGQQAQWLVMQMGGEILPLPAGPEASALLRPGRYVAEAHAGGKVMQQLFTVTEGAISTVVLKAP